MRILLVGRKSGFESECEVPQAPNFSDFSGTTT